jgi:hypothetical protein
MKKNIRTLLELLANKLCLQYRVVKNWYKTNEYDQQQLEVINRQVANNDIYIPTLVSSIINKSEYRISIY